MKKLIFALTMFACISFCFASPPFLESNVKMEKSDFILSQSVTKEVKATSVVVNSFDTKVLLHGNYIDKYTVRDNKSINYIAQLLYFEHCKDSKSTYRPLKYKCRSSC